MPRSGPQTPEERAVRKARRLAFLAAHSRQRAVVSLLAATERRSVEELARLAGLVVTDGKVG
jgi:hypothetical protein